MNEITKGGEMKHETTFATSFFVKGFWTELKTAYGNEDVEKMFTMPQRCWNDQAIYKMKTKEDFIFDDAFWDIFHKYPFHICHISWIAYELRFREEEKNG